MKNSTPISPDSVYQSCKDYTVSGKTFNLLLDEERDMLITYPKPGKSELAGYYESEDYISHTDAKKSISDIIYHWVRKYMLRKKLNWIDKRYPSRGKILDFGAGTGDFLSEAKIRGWKVYGVEPNKKARALAEIKGIKLFPDTANFKSEKFDVITLWHVLEHVYDLRAQIIELEHLLKKGGLLIIAVPNFKSYDAQYYKEHWAAFDVPRHLWHFSQNSFKHLLSGTAFKKSGSKPLVFDSFYVSLLSEKNKNNRLNYLKSLYIGLRSNLEARSTSEYSSIAYFFRKSG